MITITNHSTVTSTISRLLLLVISLGLGLRGATTLTMILTYDYVAKTRWVDNTRQWMVGRLHELLEVWSGVLRVGGDRMLLVCSCLICRSVHIWSSIFILIPSAFDLIYKTHRKESTWLMHLKQSGMEAPFAGSI